MKANSNILGEVERLDDSPFRYFLGELYGDNSLGTMLPFGLPSPACDSNVPSSGPLSVTHCGLLPCITGVVLEIYTRPVILAFLFQRWIQNRAIALPKNVISIVPHPMPRLVCCCQKHEKRRPLLTSPAPRLAWSAVRSLGHQIEAARSSLAALSP